MVLRVCYAMPSTDVPHVAMVQRACYAKSGTDIPHLAGVLRALATRCPVLKELCSYQGIPMKNIVDGIGSAQVYHLPAAKSNASSHLSSTRTIVSAYAFATRCPVLTESTGAYCAISGAVGGHNYVQVSSATGLGACYAVSGTEVAYAATSSTYARHRAPGKLQRALCAMSGTGIAYGGMSGTKKHALHPECAVLISRMTLPEVGQTTESNGDDGYRPRYLPTGLLCAVQY
eukprot:3137457-Rhodomonas_salina.4